MYCLLIYGYRDVLWCCLVTGKFTVEDVLEITGDVRNGGLKSAVVSGKRLYIGVGGSLAHFVNSDSTFSKGRIRKVQNTPN